MATGDDEDDGLRRVAEQRIGKTIKGKYRIDHVLGIGGMAVVYAATHRNQAELAIKMLHPELSIRDEIRARFLREGYAANSVKHASVVKVVDDDVAEDGAAFLVMEMLHGREVGDLWEKSGHHFPLAAALVVVDQLLDVLEAAHAKGIVHRDIKPSNLFITREGTVKVLDFGIARVRDAVASTGGHRTGSNMVLGTPAFMAPEQALANTSEIDAQSDVWAAGATLFTLLAGRYVHAANNASHMLVMAATETPISLSSAAPDTPPAIVEVVDRALASSKAQRWPSAAAMREALRAAARESLGAFPAREVLEGLLMSAEITDPQHAQFSATVLAPVDAVPGVGATTTKPFSSRPIAAEPRSRSSRVALVTGIGIVFVLLGVGAIGFKWSKSPTIAPATTTAAPLTPSLDVAMVTTSAMSASASASATASATTTATTPAAVTTHAHSTSKPATVTSAKPDCESKFYYDAKGVKVFKEECL